MRASLGDRRVARAAAVRRGGTPLAFAIVGEAQLRGGLAQGGLPPFIIDAIASMQASFVDGAYDIVTGDVEMLAGRPPRSLPTALAGAFA